MLPYPSDRRRFVQQACDVRQGLSPPIFRQSVRSVTIQEPRRQCSLVTYEETRPVGGKNQGARGHPQYAAVAPRQNGWNPAFKNDTSLTDGEIDTIVRWVDSGMAQGNPKDLPPAKMWPSGEGWQLAEQFGQPDIVVQSEPYSVPAVAQDAWWKPLSEALAVTEPRWVRAVEMRPGSVAGRPCHSSCPRPAPAG